MSDLNSLWLKSFTILCEERHFTRAAARLNMTQPGMSQHIAKLEQHLGAVSYTHLTLPTILRV